MIRTLSGSYLRVIVLAAAAGCTPAVGGSVGRAGPPARREAHSVPRAGGAAPRVAARQGISDPAPSVSDVRVQPLVVQASVLERSGRLFAAARRYEQAALALQSDDPAVLQLLVRAARLYGRSRHPARAFLALNQARTRAKQGYERLFVLRLMARMVRHMGADASVVRLYGRLRGTMAAALLAPTVASYWVEHNKPDLASKVMESSKRFRPRLESLFDQGKTVVPGRIGVLLTLRGPYRRVARSLLRGAMLAINAGTPAAATKGLHTGMSGRRVWIEPVDDDPRAAVRRLRVLDRVGVAIGPVWPAKARIAATEAQVRNLALIAVSPDPTVASVGSLVFDYMPDAKRRLAALFDAVMAELRCRRADAARALQRTRWRRRRPVRCGRARSRRRARRNCVEDYSGPVAVIVPEGAYGRALAAVVTSRHPGAVEVFTYKRGQTTFSELTSALRRKRISAVVAVMPWRTLELFAPQMAAAGIWPGRGPKGRRSVAFGALGDGVLPGRLVLAQRYLAGTLLVPGFYPDEKDPRWGGFVSEYRRVYGTAPDMVAAYAYEAASIARRASRHLKGTSPAAWIAGLTIRGTRVFDEKGALVRPPTVYQVASGGMKAWQGGRCTRGRRSGGRRWRRTR